MFNINVVELLTMFNITSTVLTVEVKTDCWKSFKGMEVANYSDATGF